MSIEEDVRHIRAQQRARREALGPRERSDASRAVCGVVRGMEAFRSARRVMAYCAVRGEPSVDGLFEELLSSGKALLLPRCEEGGGMTARRVTDLKLLRPGRYGILEPADESEVVPAGEIDLILVPGVAFDARGGRIGQGGGYYDRFLPGSAAFRLGICHSFALLTCVPQHAHDMRMDALATPEGLIDCRKEHA